MFTRGRHELWLSKSSQKLKIITNRGIGAEGLFCFFFSRVTSHHSSHRTHLSAPPPATAPLQQNAHRHCGVTCGKVTSQSLSVVFIWPIVPQFIDLTKALAYNIFGRASKGDSINQAGTAAAVAYPRPAGRRCRATEISAWACEAWSLRGAVSPSQPRQDDDDDDRHLPGH